MAGVEEFWNDGGTDEAGGAGEKDTHGEFSLNFYFGEDWYSCCLDRVGLHTIYTESPQYWLDRPNAFSLEVVWIRFRMCCRC
jgi:hypothetical protein